MFSQPPSPSVPREASTLYSPLRSHTGIFFPSLLHTSRFQSILFPLLSSADTTLEHYSWCRQPFICQDLPSSPVHAGHFLRGPVQHPRTVVHYVYSPSIDIANQISSIQSLSTQLCDSSDIFRCYFDFHLEVLVQL